MLSLKNSLVAIPRYVILLFVVLFCTSIYFYKGGTLHNPDTIGYSFSKNFFSDLGILSEDNIISVILFSELSPMLVGGVALVIGLLFARLATRRYCPAPRGKNKVGITILSSRGIAAAIAIGVAVWLSQQGSPLLAGIASVFPAIFLTTMVALWISQGEEVPSGAVGPMMLGSMSVSLYALVATVLIPSFGIISVSYTHLTLPTKRIV